MKFYFTPMTNLRNSRPIIIILGIYVTVSGT